MTGHANPTHGLEPSASRSSPSFLRAERVRLEHDPELPAETVNFQHDVTERFPDIPGPDALPSEGYEPNPTVIQPKIFKHTELNTQDESDDDELVSFFDNLEATNPVATMNMKDRMMMTPQEMKDFTTSEEIEDEFFSTITDRPLYDHSLHDMPAQTTLKQENEYVRNVEEFTTAQAAASTPLIAGSAPTQHAAATQL